MSSKSVALLARTRDDLNLYDRKKVDNALGKAHLWFNILENMPVEAQVKLAEEVNGKTMCGEHISNDKHQQFAAYDRETIVFYAVVDNYGEYTCWPLARAHDLFKRYGLAVVTTQDEGTYDSYASLAEATL